MSFKSRYLNVVVILVLFSFSISSCQKNNHKNPVAPKSYSSVYLTQISVLQIPWSDPNGNSWDFSGWPDIQVDLLRNDRIIYGTATRLDVSPNQLPVNFAVSPILELLNWDTQYELKVYDEDPLGWEFIGATSFRINGIISSSGYPSSYTMQAGNLRIRINLRWEY